MNLATFKGKTTEQLHVLQHLKENFRNDSFICIEIVDHKTIKVIDHNNEEACFFYDALKNEVNLIEE